MGLLVNAVPLSAESHRTCLKASRNTAAYVEGDQHNLISKTVKISQHPSQMRHELRHCHTRVLHVLYPSARMIGPSHALLVSGRIHHTKDFVVNLRTRLRARFTLLIKPLLFPRGFPFSPGQPKHPSFITVNTSYERKVREITSK